MVLGVADEAGMLRHVDEAKRLAALRLVREGRLFDLGRVLDESVPVFPGRYYRQTLVTTAHHANGDGVGDNRVNWITEIVSGTQPLGTHLDALSHLQEGDRGYGGISVAELAGDAGVRALGVENLDLSEPAAAGVRRFALVLTHARLRGATGAWTSPIALA